MDPAQLPRAVRAETVYTLSKIAEALEEDLAAAAGLPSVAVDASALTLLATLVTEYAAATTVDLAAFAQHRRSKNISAADVKLLARRDRKLLALLAAYEQEHAPAAGAGGGRSRPSTAGAGRSATSTDGVAAGGAAAAARPTSAGGNGAAAGANMQRAASRGAGSTTSRGARGNDDTEEDWPYDFPRPASTAEGTGRQSARSAGGAGPTSVGAGRTAAGGAAAGSHPAAAGLTGMTGYEDEVEFL
jgi:histone H3/H4